MRTRGHLYALIAVAALLTACDGPKPLTTASQELLKTGRRIAGASDLSEPRFTNGGANAVLTVTGLDAAGFATVYVLDAVTLRSAVVSRADTILNQATGLDIEIQPDDDSHGGSAGQDGSFAVFLSVATNLLELQSTTFERQHLYLRDVYGEANELISTGTAPEPGNASRILIPETGPLPEANDHTSSAVISGDRRYIVFATAATNVVPLAKSGLSQIYVFDRAVRAMELISRIAIGSDVLPGDGHSDRPYIDTNGRFVVFRSNSTNLIEGEPEVTVVNGQREITKPANSNLDLFVFNRTSRTMQRLHLDDGSTYEGQKLYWPRAPMISDDGRIVVFSAQETENRHGGDRQIYVHDLSANETTLVSVNNAGDPANGDSKSPSLDQRGRYVVFQSDALDLVGAEKSPVPPDNRIPVHIYAYDIVLGEIMGVTPAIGLDGERVRNDSISPTISPEGTLIAYVSRVLRLVGPDGSVKIVEEDGRVVDIGTQPPPPSQALDLYVTNNPFLPTQ